MTADDEMCAAFRSALRQFPSGVVVVTNWLDHRPWGLTISSFGAVSVDPPCVLVSLARNVTSFRAIAKLGYFGVSMVSRDQIDVVRRASAPGHPKYLDEESADRAVSDGGRGRHRNRPMPLSPMLTNAPFHFDCRVVHIHNSGDHGVIFAEVVKIRRGERDGPGTPLLYFDGRFHHLGAPLPAV